MQNQETLTLNDMKLMAQIIKVVSNRGAIQADEMATVGVLYNKLTAFIAAATPPEEPKDVVETPADATEGETTNG